MVIVIVIIIIIGLRDVIIGVDLTEILGDVWRDLL